MTKLAALFRHAGTPTHGLMPAKPRRRDARVDVLRGLALLMIFADHIPKNVLNRFTLHNFGLCDAAEIFVTLAGFSSMMAYGTKFEREGVRSSNLMKIVRRCLRIYVVQVGLLLLTLFVVWLWTQHFQIPPIAVEPIFEAGMGGVLKAVTLRALPGYLDILPLYIVLLGIFPVIYLAMRRHIGLALGLSGIMWLAANLDHDINLPNAIDSNGWYFNPFTWQLLFTIGAALAVLMARQGDILPRRRWLVGFCWTYLVFAFFQGASWADWGLPNLQLFAMAPPDKSHLSPLRIMDILALLYLFMSSPIVSALLHNRVAALIGVCGKHSLEVFAVGCTCALFFRLLSRTYGGGPAMQILMNVVGMSAMCLMALALEQRRARKKLASQEIAASTAVVPFTQDDFGVYRTL